MASFHEIETAAPDLASRARAILTSTQNAVLGTVRRDGSLRLSGIDPIFVGEQLCLGSMPGARKAADLKRDPRMALHSIPWDSRRLRDGADDPGAADAKIAGTAVLAEGDSATALREWLRVERGYEPPEDSDLFTIDIESLVIISVSDDQLVVDRWSVDDGRHTVRRA